MDILNNALIKDDKIKKNEIEQVVREQQEYTLLGQYVITKGLKLFSYNPSNSKIEEVVIKRGEFIQCIPTEFDNEGNILEWVYFDPENYNTTIDSRNYYLQALNMNSAVKRVEKFKQGKIKDLFNLKKPNPGGIDFFKML